MLSSCLTRRCLSHLLCALLVVSTSAPLVFAQKKTKAAIASGAPANGRPRLVVSIVIDQFRQDYLQRFPAQFGEGGFKRLLAKGAVFTNANYIHSPTVTACGHATVLTGAPPALTGIIANEWYDRDLGKNISSVSDDKAQFKALGGKADTKAAAPHKLLGNTLGDELKLASIGRSKVVGISYKDRSAILPVGKRPDGAYWFNDETGNFISSTYYFNELPAWVSNFNQTNPVNAYFGKQWTKMVPEANYSLSTADDMEYEKRSKVGTTFPYQLTGGEDKPGKKFVDFFEATPFANDHLVAFAKAAIEAEALGADDTPDLLSVSFSANDLLGHAFGPYSQEVQDMTLRTDRSLAELLNYLDQKIGANRYVVTLTADHGVAPVAEQVKAMGYGGRIEGKKVTDTINAILNARYGEATWVKGGTYGNYYLDLAAIEKYKVNLAEVEMTAATAVAKLEGINACYTHSQLAHGQIERNAISDRVMQGFHPKRNGNLIVVPEPFFYFGEGSNTTHGSPYSYDTRVPVIFYGPGITPGFYHDPAAPTDIAPTLATLLNVQPPSNSMGRILREALR